MKRSPLRRTVGLKRGRLNPMSAKRRSELEERQQVRDYVIRRDRTCRAPGYGLGGQCAGPLDCHEILPRSADPKGWLDVSNVILLCRRHHDWVTENPAEAHRAGLHRFSWEGRANVEGNS